ncbi:MAG: hypothetical protein AAFR22_03100, partial [Chloroflexota bacterium]
MMILRKIIAVALSLLMLSTLHAQNDALNLPAPLFVLQNEGVVQRYGQGAEGVSSVTPPDAFVIDFGVAPDGNRLAYRTEDALVITEIRTGQSETVDVAPGFPSRRGEGSTVAWSPTGNAIAYTTQTGLRLTLRGPDGNTAVDLINSSGDEGFYSVSWSPDGRYLVGVDAQGRRQIYRLQNGALSLASQTPPSFDMVWAAPGWVAFAPVEGGVMRMNLADSNNQSIVRPADAAYSNMTLRSNGEIAAFVRRGDAIDGPEGVYTRINPVEAREDVVGEVAIGLDGVRWTPQNDLIMVFQGGVMALVNPTDGSGFALPISGAVTYDWGRLPVPATQGYPVPRNVFFLAPDDAGITQVWQLPQSGTPPLTLTGAAQPITGYTVSVDGTFIAYSSGAQLWLQPVGGDPFTVADLSSAADAQPDFSADGQQLAYVDNSIRVFSLADGSTRVFLQNEPDRTYAAPRFSPDGAALMVDVITDAPSTGIIDLASSEVQLFPAGYASGRWLAADRVMTFGGVLPGSQAGVQFTQQGQITVVLPGSVNVADAVVIPRGQFEDIRLITGSTQLQVYDYRQPAGLIPLVEQGVVQGPHLSPDGSVVAGLANTIRTPAGELQGQLTFVSVTTGEQVTL